MTWTIIVLAILALVLWSFYISWRASRLDRLHNRVEAARTALDLALVRRAAAASELASSGLLDPATSLLLADAVRRARQANPAERDLAESDLTRALRATLGEPGISGELENGTGAVPSVPAQAAALPPASLPPIVLPPVDLPPVDLPPVVLPPAAAPPAALPAGTAHAGHLSAGTAPAGPPPTRTARVRALPQEEDPAADDGTGELFAEVGKAAHQVFIARKFYNDVAGRTIDARRRPLARVLRLSGSARQPEFFDMDDALTDGDG